MKRLLLLLLLLLPAGAISRAQEEADLGEAARLVVQRLEQARGLFEQAEFARAIPLLGELVEEIGAEPQAGLAIERRAVLLEALRLRGIALFNLGEAEPAKYDFERLLRLHPRAELDAKLVSPKVMAVFTAARDRVTGTLAVRSTPPGATVLVDGVEVGVTPLDPVRVATGAHRMTLTRRDHAPLEESIELTAGAGLSREVSLVRNARSLRIASVPAGVRITLDGVAVGTTAGEPEAVLVIPSVPVGDRSLRAEKECHQPLQTTVVVGLEGSLEIPLDVQPIVLTPSIGRLEVTSIPAGAAVSVDGIAVGTTPLTLATVCAGKHVVHLSLASVGSWSETVLVTAGEQGSVRAELRLGLVSLGAIGFGDRDDEKNAWIPFVDDIAARQTAYRTVPRADAAAQSQWELERHLLESSLGSTPLGEELRRGLAESTGADLALLALRTTTGQVDLILIRFQDGRFDRLPAVAAGESERAELARQLSAGPPEPHLWTGVVVLDVPDGLMVLRGPGPATGGAENEVRVGDRVLTIEGQPVNDRRAFVAALAGREAGERVRIGIDRSGHRREVTLPILASPDLEPPATGARMAVKLTADLDRLRAMAATSEAEVGLLGLRQALALLQAGDPRGALATGLGQATAAPPTGAGVGMVELLRGICLELTGEAGIGPAMTAYAAAAKRDAATLWRDDGLLIGPLAAAFLPASGGASP